MAKLETIKRLIDWIFKDTTRRSAAAEGRLFGHPKYHPVRCEKTWFPTDDMLDREKEE